MEGKKVDIHGVPETMLQTLYARAKETEKNKPYFKDEMSLQMAKSIDYDFSKASRDAVMSSGVIARTILLDRMVRRYLTEHPHTVVVNIACGLDTRCYRMENLFERWYNLDLPEVIAVRRRFLTEEGKIRTVAKSAMDGSWAEEIETDGGPVLIIIEGLSMYLTLTEIRRMFAIIGSRFKQVCVMMETMNPFVASHIKEKSIEGSHAKFVWGVKNGRMLQRLLPDFEVVDEQSLTEGMKVFAPIYKVLGKIGFIRDISNKIMVLKK